MSAIIIRDVPDSHVHYARRVRLLECELKLEQEMRSSTTNAITEIVRELKAGKPVTITDQWGDSATAYPAPSLSGQNEGGA